MQNMTDYHNNNEQLPNGWVQAIDPNSGRPYYACPATGESSWTIPVTTTAPKNVLVVEMACSQQQEQPEQHLQNYQQLQQPSNPAYLHSTNNIQPYNSTHYSDSNVSNYLQYDKTPSAEFHYQLQNQQNQIETNPDSKVQYYSQQQQQQQIHNQHLQYQQQQQEQQQLQRIEHQPFLQKPWETSMLPPNHLQNSYQPFSEFSNSNAAPNLSSSIPNTNVSTSTLPPSLSLPQPPLINIHPHGGPAYTDVPNLQNNTPVQYYPQPNTNPNMLSDSTTTRPVVGGTTSSFVVNNSNNSTELLLVVQARGLMDQLRDVEIIQKAKQQQEDNVSESSTTNHNDMNNNMIMKNTELSTFTAGQIADLCSIYIQQCVQLKGGDEEDENNAKNEINPYYMPIDPYELEINSKRDFMEPGRIETRLHSLYEKLKKIPSTSESESTMI